MTDRIPAALREALWSPALVSQHEDNATPTGSLLADRARAMAAALRWALGPKFDDEEAWADWDEQQIENAFAALEQESEGT